MTNKIVLSLLATTALAVFCAAAGGESAKDQYVMSDTDKILSIQLPVSQTGQKTTVPEGILELGITATVNYEKVTITGAVVNMRVPVKRVSSVRAKITAACKKCKVIAENPVPIPTPTRVTN